MFDLGSYSGGTEILISLANVFVFCVRVKSVL